MTFFQIILLAATAFFAFKIYEHVQSMNDMEEQSPESDPQPKKRLAQFDPVVLVEQADSAYEEGDLGKAKALLAESDVKAPNTPEILNKLGFQPGAFLEFAVRLGKLGGAFLQVLVQLSVGDRSRGLCSGNSQ